MNTKLSLSVWSIASILGIVLGVLLLGQAVLLVSGAATTGAAGQTLVVDDNGNACPNAEFQTIQAAVDEAASGDTVRVCSGSYTGNVVVTVSNVTIRATGNVRLTDTDPQSGYGDCWSDYEGPKFTGFRIAAPHVTVEGFELRNYLMGFYVQDTINTNILNNVVVNRRVEDLTSPCGTWGVYLNNASNTLIINNNLTTESGDSIRISESPNTIIQKNTLSRHIDIRRSDRTHIADNTIRTLQENVGLREGIRVRWSNDTVLRNNTLAEGDIKVGAWDGATSTQTRILNNTVHDGEINVHTSHTQIENNSVGIDDSDSYQLGATWHAIGLFDSADETVIRGNEVRYSNGAGIYAKSADNVTITANTVGWSRYGIQLQGNLSGDVTGNTLRRNTDGLVVCGSSGGFSPGTPGCGPPGMARPSVEVTDNDIQTNAKAGILIMHNSDLTGISVHRNRFQDNGNFSISNNASGDLNATNNTFGAVTPTATAPGAETPTEKPEPGFGVWSGLLAISVILGLLTCNRHD